MNNNKQNKKPNITAQEIHELLAQAKNHEEITQVCDAIIKRISTWD